jgi:peptidoglycan/LPS O-acetylase OafA/YrhL
MGASAADRIPSLDGLRAISIGFVLIGHLAGTRGFPLSTSAGNFLNLGELGVHVFFVISGYLITQLLLDELARKDRIDLPRFYVRRTLRIFPPYYTLIAVLVLAQAAGWIQLARHDVARTLTYTSNYYEERSWYFGHTWSLSVEEQFYLMWPAVLVLARTRRAILIAAGVVLAAPLVRLGLWEVWRVSIGARFETVADAIAIGCVLAGVRDRLHRSPLYLRALASPAFALVPLAVISANLTHDHPVVFFVAGFTVINLGVALCLDWCVTFPDGAVGRVLNAAPLVFIGVMSYSLYLWQQPFLNRASSTLEAAFPLNIALAFGCALVSYYVVERPALAFRRQIERHLNDQARGKTIRALALPPSAGA